MDHSSVGPTHDGSDCKESEVSPQSAAEMQQAYFENVGSDWVKYEKKDYIHLIKKMAFAFYGSPQNEGEIEDGSDAVPDENKYELHGYDSRQKEHVMKIFEKVREQSKYSLNSEDICLSMLFVVCVKPKPLSIFKKEPADYWVDLHDRTDVDLWPTPVFRIRKCIPPVNLVDKCKIKRPVPSCKIYIDENARVYQDWESYLKENTLPKCVMVAPKGGEYKGTITDEKAETVSVQLSVVPSPALGLKARVLSRADTVSTVASVGALGVIGATLFTPVAPAVLAGAAVAIVASGLYGLVRSSLHLHDRAEHEQCIGVKDAEARNSWINIAASGVGMSSGAASNLLSKSAAAGTNMTTTGIVLTKSVTVLRHATLVTGGAGMLNGLANMAVKYRKHGEKPSKLEVLQFSMSALFFVNAAMSSKTAQSIIEESQANTINNYRASLRSNRHRKLFDKVSAETRRVAGAASGNTEVIQCIRNIRNKDQFFADVLRINKDGARNGVRISMTSDGKVNLNAQHKFNPSQLSTLKPEARVELYKQLSPADLSKPNVPTRLPSYPCRGASYAADEEDKPTTIMNIRPDDILQLGMLMMRVTSAGTESIAEKLQNLSEEAHVYFMQIAAGVLSKLIPSELQKLKIFSQDKDLLLEVVDFLFKYLKHERPLGEQSDDDNDFVVILKQFFQDGKVRADTLISLKEKFVDYITNGIIERDIRYNKKSVVCTRCGGFYFA